ncbi:carboxypeptidase N subunit 2-like [Diabrotica virgifera virgifera]|uniref:Insulin-like growth factor-binding protein complex acid labile subunit n=1 Tax=Diabrotica virgifera virgifera TaxID=50390 RepID=A0ABM5KFR7_DIAVI|nr:carboxypeptidase N subunit 2-like [Diabrotica virgifera virgifera]
MRFKNGIIIFFVAAIVDEVLLENPELCETKFNTVKCSDCGILRALQTSDYHFEYKTITYFECSDYFRRVHIHNFRNIFDNLQKIEVIKITKTDARRLVEGTFRSSTTLRELYLPENNISIIDDYTFGHLTALTHLFLNNNKLKSFSSFKITEGFNIKYLNLGNNIFEEMVDTALYNLKSLTYLNLDGNKFKNISMGKLINNPKTVKAVSMSNNLLTYIRLEFFDPLINLEDLNLAFNKISYIGSAFLYMEKLKTLILSYNNLAKLDTYDIPLLCHSSLEYLAIDHNLIMFIDLNVVDNLPFVKKIAIMGNPWYCNCLRNYRKALQERKIQEISASDYVNTKRTVCFADLTTKCSISTSKFVSVVLEDDRGLSLDTNTTSCHLNEFD